MCPVCLGDLYGQTAHTTRRAETATCSRADFRHVKSQKRRLSRQRDSSSLNAGHQARFMADQILVDFDKGSRTATVLLIVSVDSIADLETRHIATDRGDDASDIEQWDKGESPTRDKAPVPLYHLPVDGISTCGMDFNPKLFWRRRRNGMISLSVNTSRADP